MAQINSCSKPHRDGRKQGDEGRRSAGWGGRARVWACIGRFFKQGGDEKKGWKALERRAKSSQGMKSKGKGLSKGKKALLLAAGLVPLVDFSSRGEGGDEKRAGREQDTIGPPAARWGRWQQVRWGRRTYVVPLEPLPILYVSCS